MHADLLASRPIYASLVIKLDVSEMFSRWVFEIGSFMLMLGIYHLSSLACKKVCVVFFFLELSTKTQLQNIDSIMLTLTLT